MGRILKLSMQCLYGEGNETWKYRLTSLLGLNSQQQRCSQGKKKKKREREITWSVEEETFLRIRERCLKETEFISAQQMLIYHLPCTSTEHHSKIENENHVESVVQQESEKWERMNSVHPRRVLCEHGHWLPRNPRGGVWKQVRDMDIKGGKTKREE